MMGQTRSTGVGDALRLHRVLDALDAAHSKVSFNLTSNREYFRDGAWQPRFWTWLAKVVPAAKRLLEAAGVLTQQADSDE